MKKRKQTSEEKKIQKSAVWQEILKIEKKHGICEEPFFQFEDRDENGNEIDKNGNIIG
jgi:L-rhamnose mutarotase